MKPPVINIADLEFTPWGRGAERPGSGTAAERFQARLGPIGPRIGAQQLGYNLTVVPPGKCAFPAHNHRVNEEMFFILSGTGELRIGEEIFPLRSGDVVACPAGGPETAHQISNVATDEELRYLAVSTARSPEICDYPDSGKFGVFGHFPDAEGKTETLRILGRSGDTLEYWSGED